MLNEIILLVTNHCQQAASIRQGEKFQLDKMHNAEKSQQFETTLIEPEFEQNVVSTDILTFIFKFFLPLCVISAAGWWWFCFCLKDYELINEIVFPVYTLLDFYMDISVLFIYYISALLKFLLRQLWISYMLV